MNVYDKIAEAKRILDEDLIMNSPGLAASILRDDLIVRKAGLHDLAWILASPMQNVHKNDVLGLIELLENFLNSDRLKFWTVYDLCPDFDSYVPDMEQNLREDPEQWKYYQEDPRLYWIALIGDHGNFQQVDDTVPSDAKSMDWFDYRQEALVFAVCNHANDWNVIAEYEFPQIFDNAKTLKELQDARAIREND